MRWSRCYDLYRLAVAALAAATTSIHIENSFFSDPLIAGVLMHKAREFRARVVCDGVGPNVCAARRRDAVQIYLVLPDSSEIAIEVVGGRDMSANFDMQSLATLLHGDRILVKRAEHSVRFLHPRGWSYFATLRKKLRWNEGSS